MTAEGFDGDGAAAVLARLWERIGRQDWAGLGDVLDPGVTVRYVHTGEVFGRDAIIALNRDYPGVWLADVEEVLGAGDRAASRVRVYNEDAEFYAASFAVVAGGRIVELTEVWADAGQEPPDRVSA
jgi:SnoaL-like domain